MIKNATIKHFIVKLIAWLHSFIHDDDGDVSPESQGDISEPIITITKLIVDSILAEDGRFTFEKDVEQSEEIRRTIRTIIDTQGTIKCRLMCTLNSRYCTLPPICNIMGCTYDEEGYAGKAIEDAIYMAWSNSIEREWVAAREALMKEYVGVADE